MRSFFCKGFLVLTIGLLSTSGWAEEQSREASASQDSLTDSSQDNASADDVALLGSDISQSNVGTLDKTIAKLATSYCDGEAFLKSRGIETYGWLELGIGANAWGADWNGPVTFKDRSWQAQMNQLYLVTEKKLVEDVFSLGARLDLLYGTDFMYTVSSGLDAFGGSVDPLAQTGPRWSGNRYYGLAMPQLYAEFGSRQLHVKLGHFYSPIGYEEVAATGNFFSSLAYTKQYGEPFTHTGVLGVYEPHDQMKVVAGITNGWDNWDTEHEDSGPIANPGYPNFDSEAAFLGAITFSSTDGKRSLAIANSTGNELSGAADLAGANFVGQRSITSVVYQHQFTEALSYVYQSDFGYQANAQPFYETQGQEAGAAYWYGINQYLYYKVNESLTAGLRFEWFRDNNGTRVVSGLREGSPSLGGWAGNFWSMTWGLNISRSSNVVIRPELRYDWFDGDAGAGLGPLNPFGPNGTKDNQFYGACSIIWTF